jgi:hypothetical protein
LNKFDEWYEDYIKGSESVIEKIEKIKFKDNTKQKEESKIKELYNESKKGEEHTKRHINKYITKVNKLI